MPIVEAPAKLTRSLRMTGLRSDGYHLIDAEMVTLELCDVLDIDPDGEGLLGIGPFSAGMPLDGSNLVAKALVLAGRTAG
ncbi:MAG: 4-diphosphocytidyl-2-C-methyl-D-erythritol kinase, partial [Actinomycetota bacterium]